MIWTTAGWVGAIFVLGSLLGLLHFASYKRVGNFYLLYGDHRNPVVEFSDVIVSSVYQGIMGGLCCPTTLFAISMTAMAIIYNLRKP